MKARLILGAAALSALTLSGCATIVGERDETITLNSSPSAANVKIIDERGSQVFTGTTPTTAQLKKADGSYFGGKTYTVSFDKQGYESRTLTINSTANGWYVAGNFVFGGLIGWLVVDPLTGAMYNLSPSQLNAELNERVVSVDEGGKALNIVMLEDVPSYLHKELVLIGQA